MTAFATTSDLAALRGEAGFDAAETAQAQLALDLVSEAIRGVCQQTISAVAADKALLRGNWSSRLTLPEGPVTAVTSVKINGNLLTADVDYWWSGRDTLLRGAKATTRGDWGRIGWWGGPDSVVEVVYDHGYATIPSLIRTVCLAAANRFYENPTGIASERLGEYEYRYAVEGRRGGEGGVHAPAFLSASEFDLLNHAGYVRSTASLLQGSGAYAGGSP